MLFEEMHFVGGSPDPVLAMRTAQQLLAEAGQNTIKVVLHVHRHRLPASVEAEVERLAHQENIALLDLFYERWASLENLEPYWSSQLCMLQALIERLEDTVPANVDEIFFGPGYQQGRITPPAVATPQPTIVSIVTEAPSVDARQAMIVVGWPAGNPIVQNIAHRTCRQSGTSRAGPGWPADASRCQRQLPRLAGPAATVG